MRVAVIGTGNVGGTLGRAFARAGHTVVFGSRHPPGATDADVTTVRQAVAAGDVVLVAIPGGAVEAFAHEHGSALDGKLVIDTANRLGGHGPAHSARAFAEHASGARYARAFNSLGWENFAQPDFGGVPADLFFSGPVGDRLVVEELVRAVGLRPVFVGDGQEDVVDGVLRLWLALAVGQRRGRRLAFRVLEP